MKKLRHSIGNGFWQLLQSAATLMLSMAIVRLFDASVWGSIVAIIVVQQIANSVLSWGNRDFLQREIACAAKGFNTTFTALFTQRAFLIPVVIAVVFLTKVIELEYFLAFTLIVIGRFWQQSFDIIILREREFNFAIALEAIILIGQIAAIIGVAQTGNANISALLAVFWISPLLKAIVFSIKFKHYFSLNNAMPYYLPQAFFFAMLSLTGLVHSKIDLLLVSRFLDNDTLGKYQIITAFLWSIQSIAMYVSGPFVHNFYRLDELAKHNSGLLLRRIGLAIVPFAVMAKLLMLQFGFKIAVNWQLALASILFSGMSFIYLPWIFRLNHSRQENRVLAINIGGIALLAAMLIIANRYLTLTLESVLWIVTLHQFIITFCAFIAQKNLKVCTT